MTFLRKIIGSPLRFFGFLSFLLFLLTAAWRWSSGVFQGNTWYNNLSPLAFTFLSIILYLSAFIANDLKSKQSFSSRLLGSPLKLIAFCLIILGALIAIFLIAWIHYENTFIWPISGGIILYTLEAVFSRSKTSKKRYWLIQFIGLTTLGLVLCLIGLHSTAKTDFITTNQKEFIIIYEIEDYPPLPRTIFWRKELTIPESGILITSSSALELPGYRKNFFDNEGNSINMQRQYNEEYCSVNNTVVSVDYFASNLKSYHIPCGQTEVQLAFQKVFDSICQGLIKSKFNTTTSKKKQAESRATWCKKYKENIKQLTK